jgi:arylsulfatase A-like enzyme
VVVYSSDHGEMLGEHRLLAKAMPYDAASRVPLILRAPGLAPQRVASPVSQVDLVPTLLELLGRPSPDHVQGESLVPALREGTAGTADAGGGAGAAGGVLERDVVIEWHGAPRDGGVSGYQRPRDGRSPHDERVVRAMRAQHRCIVTERWKLTVDELGEHELYDLETDPLEAHNLLFGARLKGHPEAAAAAQRLWERLRAWQRRVADPLTLPEPRAWGGENSAPTA